MDSYASEHKLKIVGVYFANELQDDESLSWFATTIATRIRHNSEVAFIWAVSALDFAFYLGMPIIIKRRMPPFAEYVDVFCLDIQFYNP